MTEILITKQAGKKVYDLEERTFILSRRARDLCKRIYPKTIDSFEYIKQLIRSTGSVAANYIEANEALGKKDFIHRIKICRKEAKESRLWLRLLDIGDNEILLLEQTALIQETLELTKIFTAILTKSQ